MPNSPKKTKKCVVCGREFFCSPSDKITTCSPECRKARQSSLSKSPTRKSPMKDLSGQKFGRLTVLEPTNERKKSCVVWLCKCECGNICKADTAALTSGQRKSCGCLRKEKQELWYKRAQESRERRSKEAKERQLKEEKKPSEK